MSAAASTLRLFCALRFSGELCAEIARWQLRTLHGGRLVARENLHMTLAFVGDTPVEKVDVVADALRGAAGESEPITFAPRGYRETRRVGMLIFDDIGGHGAALAAGLSGRLAAVGLLDSAAQRWLPHITVLAFGSRPGSKPLLPVLGQFSPSDAAVYSSTLRPGGARYVVVEAMALGG